MSALPAIELTCGSDIRPVRVLRPVGVPSGPRADEPGLVRDADEEEFALVRDPAELVPRSRAALERALAVAGFVFEVTRVLEIEEEVEIRRWRVETQQGPRTFQTRLDDWPRTLPHGGLLIRDLAGDLYHLGRPGALDRQSRDLLWAFVD